MCRVHGTGSVEEMRRIKMKNREITSVKENQITEADR